MIDYQTNELSVSFVTLEGTKINDKSMDTEINKTDYLQSTINYTVISFKVTIRSRINYLL